MQNNYIQKLQPVNHDHTLDEVTQFAKTLGVKTFDFPDDMAMKDYRSSIEKKIVDTVHPYKIYENKRIPGQWATYIYDRFRKGKRRNIRRRNYDELIEHNPIHDVDFKRLPFKPVPDKQEDVFTREDAYKLPTYLEPLNDPYALAIRLDFNLFIRIGELAGLKWENIDFIKRTVYICHQITYEPELDDELNLTEKKMVTENYLKGCTSQGFRTEHLRDEAIEILKRAKEINPDGESVFMPNGKPIITLTFNKRLKKYCEEAGIPYHSSHKIRFYACSTAYNGENLPQLSRMMGCGVPVARGSHRPSRQTRPVRSAQLYIIFEM